MERKCFLKLLLRRNFLSIFSILTSVLRTTILWLASMQNLQEKFLQFGGTCVSSISFYMRKKTKPSLCTKHEFRAFSSYQNRFKYRVVYHFTCERKIIPSPRTTYTMRYQKSFWAQDKHIIFFYKVNFSVYEKRPCNVSTQRWESFHH